VFLKRHYSFLSRVFLHSITAFGGPQAHLGMMFRHFCSDRGYIGKDELMDINTFCQLLPGATSTQTLTLIGYKRGGLPLAFMTLMIWALPAVVLMSSFAFMIFSYGTSIPSVFRFFQPMALGFLCYASWNIISTLKHKSSKFIFTVSTIITLFLFHSPWFFSPINPRIFLWRN
jgi:chromate transporter